MVTLSRDQQAAIALTVVPAVLGVATDVIDAPGQVVPDESRFAYITPRAAGIVRTVKARIGQDVQAGFVLAMIDSPEVAEARLRSTPAFKSSRSPGQRPSIWRRPT